MTVAEVARCFQRLCPRLSPATLPRLRGWRSWNEHGKKPAVARGMTVGGVAKWAATSDLKVRPPKRRGLCRSSRQEPGQVPPCPDEKQIPHSVRDDSCGSGEMFPATVPAFKSSHDPSAPRLARTERAREKASRCARDDRGRAGAHVGALRGSG